MLWPPVGPRRPMAGSRPGDVRLRDLLLWPWRVSASLALLPASLQLQEVPQHEQVSWLAQ